MEARWPPIYDADDLRETINRLVNSPHIQKTFYGSKSPTDQVHQGDILKLSSGLPLIWEDGQPAIDESIEHWLVIGNTCDIDRPIGNVTFTQIVPIIEIVDEGLTPDQKSNLLRYSLSRRFYLPDWNSHYQSGLYFADFIRPVTLHKKALLDHSKVVATMNYHSWILLHSCLVRFLARDDGRFD